MMRNMFDKVIQKTKAMKAVPQIIRMYKALCPECQQKLKERVEMKKLRNEKDIDKLMKSFCEDCQKLQ